MDTRDLLILGGIGAAAWFFFFRRQAAAQPLAAANPTAAAGMTPGAAAQTTVGVNTYVRGMTGGAPLGLRAPAPPATTLGGLGAYAFLRGALALTGKDNVPVVTPPAAPNAFFFSGMNGFGQAPATGSASTGPNPTLGSVRTNPYSVFAT